MSLTLVPTREMSIIAQVSRDPLVSAYRKATQLMNARMVRLYGPDYGTPVESVKMVTASNVEETDWSYIMAELDQEQRRMSPLDSARFESLLRGAAIARRDARARILAAV